MVRVAARAHWGVAAATPGGTGTGRGGVRSGGGECELCSALRALSPEPSPR